MRLGLLGFALLWSGMALAQATPEKTPAPAPSAATIEDSACAIVDTAAQANRIPVGLLTRLLWTESRFQPRVVSRAGAQGIAQFMPGTAAEQGLLDPFDPEQAIAKAASLLAELSRQFGNIGLAAAAYNAGSNRVAYWLAGSASLPPETQAYVLIVTGYPAENWAAKGRTADSADAPLDGKSCAEITAALRTEEGEGADQIAVAPWGVQLAGNFSKAIALASFARAQRRYVRIIGDLQPMILGTVLRSRGTRRFYRVFVPAASRAEADHICAAIMTGGGACVAVRT